MNDLARHLTETGSHGGLPFNRACSVCREERLAGTLTQAALVPPRARAGLAAALLAAAPAAPAAAIEPVPPTVVPEVESEQEGATDPGGLTGDTDDDPSSASGQDTPLGEEPLTVAPPGDEGSGNDEAGGVEPEPVDDYLDEETERPARPEAGAPARGEPDGDGGADHGGPARGGDPGTRGERTPQSVPRPPGDDGPPRQLRGPQRAGAPAAQSPGSRSGPGAPGTREPAGQTTAAAPALGLSATAAPAPTSAAPAPGATLGDGNATGKLAPGARTHVVKAGESLWSIARDLLDPRATNAEVAREVQRLWQLNAAAIGTGSPDMLIAGQTLRLR